MTNEIVGKILSFDYFGQSFFMKLDQGITSLTTWSGLICTILLLLIGGGYTGQKIDILLNNRDMEVFETYRDAYYNYTYKFDHLDFAVAFTAFDSDEDSTLDPTIGELVISAYEWGYDEDGNSFVKNTPIES